MSKKNKKNVIGKVSLEKGKELSKKELKKFKEQDNQINDLAEYKTLEKTIHSIIKKTDMENMNDKKKNMKVISELLKDYNEQYVKSEYEILKLETQKISDLSKSVANNQNYIAYVFYFWSPRNMNFRIIGLTNIYPLLEIVETREVYYLTNPTLSNGNFPIYWLIKGQTISQTIEYNKDAIEMSEQFKLLRLTPEVIKSLVDSVIFMRFFGKTVIPMRFIVIVVLSMIIEFFVIFNILLVI